MDSAMCNARRVLDSRLYKGPVTAHLDRHCLSIRKQSWTTDNYCIRGMIDEHFRLVGSEEDGSRDLANSRAELPSEIFEKFHLKGEELGLCLVQAQVVTKRISPRELL